jgi:glucosylceramidase
MLHPTVVKFFEEYDKIGIKFWGLTAQNEPAGNVGTWQDLKFSPEEERDFIKQCLGPTLKMSNVTKKIKLMMLDDQRIHLPKWTNVILGDPDSAKYIDGIAVHWYAATEDITPHELYFGFMNKTHTKYPNFFLLATEACEGFLPWSKGVELGSWTRGETYAHDIIGDINNWATGWTDWNAFLDLKGGPNWANNECDSPIILDTNNKTKFYKQPMYYTLAHFSSFVPKNSVRVGLQSTTTSAFKAPMECTGFKTPSGYIVLVVLNKGLLSTDAEYEVSYGGKLISKISAPKNSLQTIVWKQTLK